MTLDNRIYQECMQVGINYANSTIKLLKKLNSFKQDEDLEHEIAMYQAAKERMEENVLIHNVNEG